MMTVEEKKEKPREGRLTPGRESNGVRTELLCVHAASDRDGILLLESHEYTNI